MRNLIENFLTLWAKSIEAIYSTIFFIIKKSAEIRNELII